MGKTGRMDILVNPMHKEQQITHSLKLTKDTRKRGYEEIIDDDAIDMTVITRSNQIINIEIQVNNKGHMGKRSVYYASGIIFHSLPKNTSYDAIPDFIMINILNYTAIDHNLAKREKFRNDAEYKRYQKMLDERCHSVYTIREIHSNMEEIFEGTQVFHFIELPKFKKAVNQDLLNSKRYDWIKFLINPKSYITEDESLYAKAKDCLKVLGQNSSIMEAYHQREKEDMDFISALKKHGDEKYVEGEKKGMEEGRKQGMEEGEKKGMEKGRKQGMEYEKRKQSIQWTLYTLSNPNLNLSSLENMIYLSENDKSILQNFIKDRDINQLAHDLKFDKNILKNMCEQLNIDYIEKNPNTESKKNEKKK